MFRVATAEWLPYVTAFSALVVSLFTFIVGPWAEVRKLRGQRGESEREKLRDLIEKYHGRLLEAAVDWDRRMWQLYENEPARGRRGELYPRREPGHPGEHYLSHMRGVDFLDQRQYLFRSYVFRFLALCALARKFEAEAFYIDAQYARRQDFDFLKFAKALLWAMTSTDLSGDEFPGQSHFPNDQFRPLLDRCYRALDDELPHVVDAAEQSEVIFDVAFLHQLVARERELLPEKDDFGQPVVAPLRRRQVHGDDAAADGGGKEEGDLRTAGDLHKVLAYFDGLHRDTEYEEDEERLRVHRWDRLCILHLIVMAFINEFGYEWQVADRARLQRAVDEIVDWDVAKRFRDRFDELGFCGRKPTSQRRLHRGIERLGMPDIRQLLDARAEVAERQAAELLAEVGVSS